MMQLEVWRSVSVLLWGCTGLKGQCVVNKVHDLLSRLVIETENKKNKFKSSLLYVKIPNLDVDVRQTAFEI